MNEGNCSSNANPLVTVVIPTFNRKDTIVQCVQSVLDQSYGDIEVVVIDDGSTDDSHVILEQLFGDSIKVTRQQNKGQSAAVKLGVDMASGEFIAFLDSDDFWKPDKVRRQVEFMEAFPQLAACYTDAEEFVTFGEDHKSYVGIHDRLSDVNNLMDAMVRLHIPLRSTVLCRRDFLLAQEIAPDPEASGRDDVQLFMEIIGHGGKFGFIDTVTTYRRMHDTNMSSDHFKRFYDRIRTFENMLRRCKNLPRAWKNQVKKALSDSYYRVGESYWGQMELNKARLYFRKAIATKVTNSRAIVSLLMTMTPSSLVKVGRNLKRNFK